MTAVSAQPHVHSLDLGGRLVLFIFTIVPLSGITIVALAGVFADFRIASFSATAIVGMFTGAAAWTTLALYPRVPAVFGRIMAPFAAFMVVFVGSAVVGTITRQGVQFIQVLLASLGALGVAATTRWVLGEWFDEMVGRYIRFTSVLLILGSAVSALGVQLHTAPRTSAIVALLGLSWFLAEQRAGRRRAVWWALAMVVAVLISLSRTAVVAAFVLVAANFILQSRRHRAAGMAIAALIIFTGYWAMTSWAPLHDRFAQGDVSLSVGGLNVNAEGRTRVWGALWADVPDNIVLGHGPGASSAASFAIDPAFDQPHNDYLRLIYDYGTVGVALLIWFGLRIARELKKARRRTVGSVPAVAASYAALAMLILMTTDNPLDYPFVMIPLGALIGLGMGAASQSRSPAPRQHRTAQRALTDAAATGT